MIEILMGAEKVVEGERLFFWFLMLIWGRFRMVIGNGQNILHELVQHQRFNGLILFLIITFTEIYSYHPIINIITRLQSSTPPS